MRLPPRRLQDLTPRTDLLLCRRARLGGFGRRPQFRLDQPIVVPPQQSGIAALTRGRVGLHRRPGLRLLDGVLNMSIQPLREVLQVRRLRLGQAPRSRLRLVAPSPQDMLRERAGLLTA